jgi:ABC-2 type transport system ATP-binding protein
MAPLLEVHNVHKRYADTVALQGVSFAVEAGEMFGLLGPNGAGKTTLLSIVSGLLAADAGEVLVDGQLMTPDHRDLRRQLGIVPQDLALYGPLTARENLLFFGELYGLSGAALQTRVQEILAAVGLSDRADRRVDTFSGGMKRRLNLGAALVHQPRLLLLDEPSVGVDPQSRNHIFEEVRRLNEQGITVVYTSHYLEEVQALCRRIGIIDHGRLVACDTLPALLQLLAGRIALRVAVVTPALRQRLQELPGVQLSERGNALELTCQEARATLLRLAGVLQELHVEALDLEMYEPTLERVFLHLTDTALRD